MLIKLIGLGKMGFNLALNMKDNGIDVIGYDITEAALTKANENDIQTSKDLNGLISNEDRNVVWVMLPAGNITNNTIMELSKILRKNDIVIDGGNSNYKDSLRNAQILKEKEINFFDVGTSGGVNGARNGASLMVGGPKFIYNNLLGDELFLKISAKGGCLYTGEAGSGHYLKMIHNSMLYGFMQTLGEGFELLEKSDFNYNLEDVALSLSKSSVIRCWLLELLADAFSKDSDLSKIRDVVSSSKTTLNTIESAFELDVPIPIISTSLIMRLRSEQDESFSAKVIASLRDEVGGHKPKSK